MSNNVCPWGWACLVGQSSFPRFRYLKETAGYWTDNGYL